MLMDNKLYQYDGWTCNVADNDIEIKSYLHKILPRVFRYKMNKYYDYQLHFNNFVYNCLYDEEPDRIFQFSILGVHGTGKSFIMAVALCNLMEEIDELGGTMAGTLIAITEQQAQSAFWKKLEQIQANAPDIFSIVGNSFFLKRNPFIRLNLRAFAKHNPHALAGEHDPYVVNIVDEASGVPPQAIAKLRTHYTSAFGKLKGFFFLLGNPPEQPNDSEFYRIHRGEMSGWNYYDVSRRAVVRDLSKDSYTNGIIRRIQDVHGTEYDYTEHEEYRRLVLGKLPEGGSGQVFQEYILDRARKASGMDISPYYISVDFAGGDEPRDNKNYEKNDHSALAVFTDTGFIEAFAVKIKLPDFLQLIIQYIYQYKAYAVFGDALGMGLGVMQQLQLQHFQGFKPNIVSVKGSERAINHHRFKNRRAENYWMLREWMEGKYDQYGQLSCGGVARLGPDTINVLFNQLRQIKFKVCNGVIALEPKNSLNDSPDLADACANGMTYKLFPHHDYEYIRKINNNYISNLR